MRANKTERRAIQRELDRRVSSHETLLEKLSEKLEALEDGEGDQEVDNETADPTEKAETKSQPLPLGSRRRKRKDLTEAQMLIRARRVAEHEARVRMITRMKLAEFVPNAKRVGELMVHAR